MAHDDDAKVTANQEILAALDRQFGGCVGHGPIRIGGQVAAHHPAAETPVDCTDPVTAAGEPVGHGIIRLGGTVVAGPPDDAMTRAAEEIRAALNGSPTPGAL